MWIEKIIVWGEGRDGREWKKLKGQNSLVRKTVVIEIRRNEILHLRNIKGYKDFTIG